MIIRPYDSQQDQAAVHQLWQELHWIESGNIEQARSMDIFLSVSRTLVAEMDGAVASLASSVPGSLYHLDHEVPVGIVAAVTTSLVARRQGLASRLTARLVAEDAAAGQALSALGMFEQGYYSRLGFGNGAYDNWFNLNPARLDVPARARVPERLTVEHYTEVHQALLRRWRNHGCVMLHGAELVQAEMGWTENPRGFGYRNESGELTHFLWGSMKDENGPFEITAMGYRDREQLLELLALIASMSDQIYLVKLIEPARIELQDFIREPFKHREISRGGKFTEETEAAAWWQLRINDLSTCLARTRLPGTATLSFNLALSDPIGDFLPAEQPWRGIGGDYTVHLGEESSLETGHRAGLPLLRATVAGLSRLWLGCAAAHALASSGSIEGEPGLLDELEQTLRLPAPRTGWEF